jgi:L-cysteine:1D-myo-inositol 2-amino-2-deoxy-alpha-D-glucopyranoside ligase
VSRRRAAELPQPEGNPRRPLRSPLRLHDTLRRRPVAFRPRRASVTLYVCGVTPYDTTHLGHARTFLLFDVLVRHLEAGGLRVRYVQNVTDVDESILARAQSLGEDWRALGRRQERAFLADMRALGWRRPDAMPHATRELPAMRALAKRLLARGHAYALPGGLYFDVSTFPRFGALSGYSAARMRRVLAGQDDARLDDPGRRHPHDFALWRRVTDHPTWPSPFGRGRPGWHLECSAMALHYLGRPVDIHGGGADLIYPHHECEIAQSEGAAGSRFVRHWVHVAPMRLGGEKMSKSKGNMVLVGDLLRRVHPDALRLYLLSVHYRRPFDHDPGRVRASEQLAAALRTLARPQRAPMGPPEEVVRALDDDLDTPAALRALARLVRAGDAAAVAGARYLGLTLHRGVREA